MIKAIETYYKGYRFRSRTEARWAVFLDSLGIIYEYEKEGYDLGDGVWYLPDFWLPHVWRRGSHKGVWLEVKGQKPTPQENKKCVALTTTTQHPTIVAYGSVPGDDDDGNYEFYPITPDPEDPEDDGCGWDNYMRFMRCYTCRTVKIEFMEGHYCYCPLCKNPCDDQHPDITQAIIKARSSRFEHGERGL